MVLSCFFLLLSSCAASPESCPVSLLMNLAIFCSDCHSGPALAHTMLYSRMVTFQAQHSIALTDSPRLTEEKETRKLKKRGLVTGGRTRRLLCVCCFATPVWLLCCVTGILANGSIAAFGIFLPKLLQYQFALTAATAAVVAGKPCFLFDNAESSLRSSDFLILRIQAGTSRGKSAGPISSFLQGNTQC